MSEEQYLTNKKLLKETDIFLASYPHSGNTWMRLLLSDALLQLQGFQTTTGGNIIPDLYKVSIDEWNNQINTNLKFRIVKTHEPLFFEQTLELKNRAFYLFRKPADCLCSYYYYSLTQDGNKDNNKGIDEFCLKHLEQWCSHVTTYMDYKKKSPETIIFLSYEKLSYNPAKALNYIMEFLGWENCQLICQKSAENQDFNKLKSLSKEEKTEQMRFWEEDGYQDFFRKDKVNSSQEELSLETLQIIEEKAMPIYQKATLFEPIFSFDFSGDDHEYYYQLAENFYTQRELDSAITAYQKVIEINPKHSWSYQKLANIFREQNKDDQAVTAYRQVIEINPNFAWSHYHLATILEKQGKLEEAIASYQTAIEIYPNCSTFHYKLENLLGVVDFGYDLYFLAIAKVLNNKYSRLLSFYFHTLIQQRYLFYLRFASGQLEEFVDATSEPNQGNTVNKNLDSEIQTESVKILDKAPNQPQEKILAEMEDGEFINFLYETLLHRSPDETGLNEKTTDLVNGVSRTKILEDLIHSDEFKNKQNKRRIFSTLDDRQFVEYIYVTFLKRPVDEHGLKVHIDALQEGLDRVTLLESIFDSQEFLEVNKPKILEEFSNQDFLRTIWEILLGRICDVVAEKQHLRLLNTGGVSKLEIVVMLLKSEEFKRRIKGYDLSNSHHVNQDDSGNRAYIMGTDKVIGQKEWDRTLLQVLLEDIQKNQKLGSNNDQKVGIKTDEGYLSDRAREILSKAELPLVSIITSLYKGGEYIENFLSNITSGTIFEKYCELIIIDANSPEQEDEVIKQYMNRFNNIKYQRTETVITVYEAWNLAIKNSQGKFLTNANLDDLRSSDCLEKQAIALLQEDCDVVYQNFYHSFTPNLPFHIVAKCNFPSNLPVVSKTNMLELNSPHNAPMWKKSLHTKVGFFDTRYKSAADYEFWLRCLLNDAKFWKIDEPLVVYYNNPTGISTRVDTDAASEVINIQRIYSRLFSSNLLGMNRNDFIKFCQITFGFDEDSNG